jgi:hypothetical protein
VPFVKERSDLGALGVEVVAISPFSLASDTDLAVARASASLTKTLGVQPSCQMLREAPPRTR